MSRNFSFTWNNYSESSEAFLSELECRYLCYGKEIAPSTGTPHLQGVVVFERKIRLSGAIKKLIGCHVEIARSLSDLITYCKKEGQFIERGDIPATPKEKGEEEIERWNRARAAAVAGEFEEIPSDIYIRYRNSLRAIHTESQALPPDANGVTGRWYVGPPASGKSRAARSEYPGIFDKACNKWWDGYVSGSAVLLDDFDRAHRVLGHHLKRWADRYAFTGEVKGGIITIRPPVIVVTSNYSIREIFGDDVVLCEALERRFVVQQFCLSPFNPHCLPSSYPNPSPTFTFP